MSDLEGWSRSVEENNEKEEDRKCANGEESIINYKLIITK